LWAMWTALFPFMKAGFIQDKSFNDFASALKKTEHRAVSDKSAEEIEAEMDEVVRAYKQRRR